MRLFFHRTTSNPSPPLHRSLSPLFLLRQVLPPRKWMKNWRNDGRTTSSEAPGSPVTPGGNSVIRSDSVTSCGSSSNTYDGFVSGNVGNSNENWQMIRVGSFSIDYKIFDVPSGIRSTQLVPKSALDPTDKAHCYSLSSFIHFNKRKYRIDLRSKLVNMEDAATSSSSKNISKLPHESSNMSDCQRDNDIYSSLPTEFGKKRKHGLPEKSQSAPRNMKYVPVSKNSYWSKGSQEPFDICMSLTRSSAPKDSWHARKIENRNEEEDMVEFENPARTELTSSIVLLRSGMVLLKHFVTLSEQVEIVKKCRELGLSPGGFYQPGYHDGAKLRLQMMCLGWDWDPQTRKYGDRRTVDGTRPPGIPKEFSLLVKRAIDEAHAHIKEELRVSRAEEILPSMTPDICIANFYTTTGRLGLHQTSIDLQDRDESTKSLHDGLPVVSISIGDSADFLYGDQRDIAKAENVVLESGDVLIFGGPSRHIFHSVTSILPDSAPRSLLEATSLRPGRLNLTFRQY
ncbi:hypothetical protein TB2_009824 [Malus domestica]